MNNSYITIIKEKRTALSRKRIPLNQNGCTGNFRIGVPFEQNLQQVRIKKSTAILFGNLIFKSNSKYCIFGALWSFLIYFFIKS